MARQAGPALDGARLVHELRVARERLVTAREAERRRIRRDLHDDLGPSLAGLGLTASALHHLLSTEPTDVDLPASRRLAEQLTAGITDASALVRRVVYDLQPLGLEGTRLLPDLAERLTRTTTLDGQGCGMRVHVDAQLGSDDLPAAVEVAAARIVTEAVTNARRHAQASQCSVALTRSDHTLAIEVHDDGHGMRPGTALGVGLRSIEERADELGGTSELISDPTGTTLRVTLPLAPAATTARQPA
jgi:signal transduction histidine kinase